MSKQLKNISGERFGRLVATKLSKSDRINGRTLTYWECLCDCGNLIVTKISSLRSGDTKSCGCYALEVRRSMHVKHSMSNDRLYNIWSGMKSRCYYKKHHAYHNYGGRGIKMDKSWKKDFIKFYEDVKDIYVDGYSIERVNNNGNYELSNITFIPLVEQAKNRRTARLITLNGVTKSVTEWAKDMSLSHKLIFGRLRRGWDTEKAFFSPLLNNQWDKRTC